MTDKNTTEPEDLAELAALADTYVGSWKDTDLPQAIKTSLWETYDPNDDLIYPTVNNWDSLLEGTIESGNYEMLTKDAVLSILFGLIHKTRISETVWRGMFERSVTQKLLRRLLVLDSDKYSA